jgi:hypothetical protein
MYASIGIADTEVKAAVVVPSRMSTGTKQSVSSLDNLNRRSAVLDTGLFRPVIEVRERCVVRHQSAKRNPRIPKRGPIFLQPNGRRPPVVDR